MGLTQGPGAPPLALACLSAVLKREGYRVTVIDAFGEAMDNLIPIRDTAFYAQGLTIEDILARISPDTSIIGISCMFSNEWIWQREVIRAVHERYPDIPIIVGGEHATADADYVLRSSPGILAAVLGEGEQTLLDLLDAMATGRDLSSVPGLLLRVEKEEGLVRTAPRERIRDLDALPWPDWDAIPMERYLAAGVGLGVAYGRNMPMLASRGCPYKCAFCSSAQMWGRRWNTRAVEDVLAEMKHYIQKYRVDSFSFYDLTAIVRKDWLLRFIKGLIAEDLHVTWQMPIGTRSEALDPEVVALLGESGCHTLVYAPESGSPTTLERIHKKVNVDKMLLSMRACTRNRVFSKAHIILGFPGESVREMFSSIRFIARMAWVGVNDMAVYPFVPYPGSEFHDELRKTHEFPPYGDSYDLFLAYNCKSNYSSIRSWNEFLSDRQLLILCTGSAMMFYLLQYLFRPWRFFASAWRFLRGRPITLLERTMNTAWLRNKAILAAKLRRKPARDGSAGQ